MAGFDCPVLTGFSLYDDIYMCRIILSLCARHVPVQDCIPFIVPFEKPSEDEFAVAAKVFESIKRNLDEEDADQYHNPLEFQTLKPVSPSSTSSNLTSSNLRVFHNRLPWDCITPDRTWCIAIG